MIKKEKSQNTFQPSLNWKNELSISDYDLFSLPKNEVRILSKVPWENDGTIIFKIKWKVIKHKCPKCGWYNTKRVGTWYEIHTVNHMFLSNYLVIKLEIHKRRFVCKDCKNNNGWGWSTFMERFSFLKPNCDYTDDFKMYITREWQYSSIKELARKFKISETLIYGLIWSLNIEDLEKEKINFLRGLNEIWIWIDELSFRWRQYILQINELKERKIIWILKTNSKEDLEKWLDKLDIEILKKIRFVASDMNATYKSTIQKYIEKKLKYKVWEITKESIGVADHYHLKQLFSKLLMEVYNMNNWMIKAWHYDQIIKDICTLETINFNKYRTDRLELNVRAFREYKPEIKTITKENWEITENYKPITLGYFLSKRYIDLLLLKSSKLSEKQMHRLNQILFEFDPKGYLKEAYLSKELFYEAVEKNDEILLEKVINDLKDALHYKTKTCWETLEKWKREIINFFKTKITNAFTEWKNTKAKLLKRMAYWYRNKDNYIKRLLLCL